MYFSGRFYHFMAADAQRNPAPKAARMIWSPRLNFPSFRASVSAIGMDAAVVFPYLWILLNTLSILMPIRFATDWEILKFA